MAENDKAVLLYSTFPALEVAEGVGVHLVDVGLAACVNILPGMISIYRWEGQRHRDPEVVMIVKTRAGLADRVIADILAATLTRIRPCSHYRLRAAHNRSWIG